MPVRRTMTVAAAALALAGASFPTCSIAFSLQSPLGGVATSHRRMQHPIRSSEHVREDSENKEGPPTVLDHTDSNNWVWELIKNDVSLTGKMPPFQVDDLNLLFYDMFLLINLVLSISFWVVHRLDVSFLGSAFNEGCLISLLWLASGLYSGAFLDSAVDGHYGSTDERGGPRAAGLLAFHTMINAVNLRLLLAFIVAVIEHRPVGSCGGEQFMPLEVGFGLTLMSFWRTLHSSFVPRV